jgi:hypothetical protein
MSYRYEDLVDKRLLGIRGLSLGDNEGIRWLTHFVSPLPGQNCPLIGKIEFTLKFT